ncbi:MAG: YolD-like family protein [Peptococcales bacterium]|jgi:hypothetical protein
MKDRGAIKWSAMMLPEHKKLLEKMYEEQAWVEKPILDENKSEEINIALLLSLKEKKKVRIKFYREHSFKVMEGIVIKFLPISRKIKIDDNQGTVRYLELQEIVDAEII